jgi:serine/threonine protein phosphatase PrpC
MLKLDAAALNDLGRQRAVDEDRAWSQIYMASEGEPVGLFVVCDGIGGQPGGDCASQWALETVKRELREVFCPFDPRGTKELSRSELDAALRGKSSTRLSNVRKLERQVRRAVERANLVVYEYAQQRPEKASDTGTTLTLALVSGERSVVANVGDSRTYLLRDRHLRQITQDHSLVANLVTSGQIKPEDVFTHPQRNLIYRSLGYKAELHVDTFMQTLQPGDYLLLCSDGLWEMVQDEDKMAQIILDAPTTDDACRALVDAANEAGGEDNIGVVVVKII